MNSQSAKSPSYRHIASKHKHSPIELKEKMRKSYKDKVQNCRNMLLNRLRGTVAETDLRDTLTDIYKSMYNFSPDSTVTYEEQEIMEEIKNELVQEELQWWLEEHEKSQQHENVDWSNIEQDDNVICPVCQKENLKLDFGIVTCLICKYQIATPKSSVEIKKSLDNCIETHAASCTNQVVFTTVTEANETHIYLICVSCMEMGLVV